MLPLIQDGVYKRIGILVGMSIVQGGSGCPFFGPSVYDYITGKDVCTMSPTVEEIPDMEVKNCVVKVMKLYGLCFIVWVSARYTNMP